MIQRHSLKLMSGGRLCLISLRFVFWKYILMFKCLTWHFCKKILSSHEYGMVTKSILN